MLSMQSLRFYDEKDYMYNFVNNNTKGKVDKDIPVIVITLQNLLVLTMTYNFNREFT